MACGRKWRARRKGSSRTYEYLVPEQVLPNTTLDELRHNLQLFVGSFNVHNFSKYRPVAHPTHTQGDDAGPPQIQNEQAREGSGEGIVE